MSGAWREEAIQGGATLAEICVSACADAWRGDGAILASPMGAIPRLGARLAQRTSAPGLLRADGEACLLTPDGTLEGGLPYRSVFLTEAGRRIAEESRRRHHIVVALLRAVGVSEATAWADAEGIEHHCSKETLAAFDRFVKARK